MSSTDSIQLVQTVTDIYAKLSDEDLKYLYDKL